MKQRKKAPEGRSQADRACTEGTRVAKQANGSGQTLEARQVSVSFEGLTAVNSVDETLHQGEILGLIGPNGAGKTTLVNAMTGFQLPAAGEVLLCG